MHGRKYMGLALGVLSTPYKLEFFSPYLSLSLVGGTTLHLIIRFYVEIPRKKWLLKPLTKTTMRMVQNCQGTIHTEHLTCCQFGQVKFHVIFYLQCSGAKVPPPRQQHQIFVIKLMGAAHMQKSKPADSWQIYGFSTARKGFVVRYQEVEYVSKYYRHSGYVTTQSKTRASTGSPSPSLFGRF